ncbi:hypothetical protein [Streptomyces olivochromogenes]|uniref:hypothetical protein n=1 Tax=Streptomyces olivochromogenes TaxID=1963 RepID=UPI0036976119
MVKGDRARDADEGQGRGVAEGERIRVGRAVGARAQHQGLIAELLADDRSRQIAVRPGEYCEVGFADFRRAQGGSGWSTWTVMSAPGRSAHRRVRTDGSK